MKTLLVTGGNGMVGSYVSKAFSDWEIFNTDIDTLDVRDPAAVVKMVGDIKPDILLHLAAATDVDLCEKEPDLAFHTNAIGTQNVALACQKYNTELVYISTAGVFDGTKPTPYTEFDLPNPLNVYGQSKLAGEHIVSTLLNRFYIFRAGWMIGGGHKDKKFVGKITSLLLSGLKEIRIVNDKFGTPTFAYDLLVGIKSCLETGYYGLYHMANTGTCSRYDVALEIQRIIGADDVKLIPVNSAYFPLPAIRARSEAMINYKWELLSFVKQRTWQGALEEYLINEYLPSVK